MLRRRRGNKLSRANQVDRAWRAVVGGRGCSGSLRVVQTSITPNFSNHPPSPLTPTLYTHNTAI
jgi:hypothetical protein